MQQRVSFVYVVIGAAMPLDFTLNLAKETWNEYSWSRVGQFAAESTQTPHPSDYFAPIVILLLLGIGYHRYIVVVRNRKIRELRAQVAAKDGELASTRFTMPPFPEDCFPIKLFELMAKFQWNALEWVATFQ